MYKFLTKLVNLFFLTLLFGGCSSTRFFKSSDYIIDRNEIYEDGIILITVPDLRVFIKRYLDNSFQQHDDLFKHWALQRIPADSPSSFYFSIFINK